VSRLLLTLALVATPVALAALAMRVGYRRRLRRDIGEFAPLLSADVPARDPDARLRYTGTTRAGAWLERVALAGLFGRGPAELWITPAGLVFRRVRGPAVLAAPLVDVGTETGHAGQAVGTGRVVVVRWEHRRTTGESVELDSGFVAPSADAAAALAQRIADTRPAEVRA